MKTYEVWCSGSRDTQPFFVGRIQAETFQAACDTLIHRESPHYKHYCPASRSIWGCTLYPTYAEANGFRRCECRVESSEIVVTVGDKVVLQIPYTENDNGSITIDNAIVLASDLADTIDKLNMERYEQ